MVGSHLSASCQLIASDSVKRRLLHCVGERASRNHPLVSVQSWFSMVLYLRSRLSQDTKRTAMTDPCASSPI